MIALRGVSWYSLPSTSSATSHVFTIPAGTVAGDVMVLAFVTNGVAVNSLTGWTTQFNTSVVTNPRGRVFTKAADATDITTGTVTVTTSAATYGSGTLASWSGVDTGTPVDAVGTMFESATNTNTFTVASFTTVSAGAVLVGGTGANTGNASSNWSGIPANPGAWSYLTNPGTGAGGATTDGKSHCTADYLTMATAGATGALTFNLSVSRAGFAWALALRPDTGGGGGSLTSRWVGATSPSGATVATQTAGAASVRLKVATDAGLTTGVVFSSAVTPDANGYALIPITGLSASTNYFYGVEVDGTVDGVKQGKFTTLPTAGTAASFSFAFASCMNSGADTDAASRIVTRAPLLMFQLGDFHYDNNSTNDQSLFRASIAAQVARTNISSMLANVPTVYVWSDHDWGGNNSNGTAASAPAAQAVYRQVVPSHPLAVADSIERTFVVGRVRFIVTDERSHKSPQANTDDATKTMLGATQKQWLKDTITAATEPVIFWMGDTPWVGAVVVGDDHWASYSTERAELGAFFAASGKQVIRCAGDMHAVAADDGTNSVGGIPVLQGAPLNQTSSLKGGPYSQGAFPASGSTTVRQYGYVTITDTGSSITAAYTGYDTSDTAQVTLTVTPATFTTLTGDASAAGSTATMTGAATFSTLTGDAVAAGGSGTFTTPTTFTTLTGDAAADGGTATFTGAATFGTLVGDAPATGGVTTMTGAAVFATTTGDASADGGSATFSGQAVATFTTLTGDAAAAGTTASFTGGALFATTTGDAAADGGTASFVAGAVATFATVTGDATAAGGTGTMTGAALFATAVGDAAADGGVGVFVGQSIGIFTTLTGDATAAGGVGVFLSSVPSGLSDPRAVVIGNLHWAMMMANTHGGITIMDDIRAGDTAPPFTAQLLDGDEPYDPTAATEVRVRIWQDGVILVDRPATSYDATGIVTCDWQPGDTDEPGPLKALITVTTGGEITTFPPRGYLLARISPLSPA